MENRPPENAPSRKLSDNLSDGVTVDFESFAGAPPGLWRSWNRLWEQSADGSGEAYGRSTEAAIAGLHCTWVICYKVGPPGMVRGGRLVVGPEFPWGANCGQLQSILPTGDGYVTARVGRRGTALRVRCLTDGGGTTLIVVEASEELPAATVVEITLGDTTQGSAGWRAPWQSMSRLGFIVAEDLRAGGRFRRLAGRPAFAVKCDATESMRVALRGPDADENCSLIVAAMDGHGNPVPMRSSYITIRDDAFNIVNSAAEETPAGTLSVKGLNLRLRSFGTIRVAGPGHKLDVPTPPEGFMKGQQIVFGDIHGHNPLDGSFGVSGIEGIHDYFNWARQVEGLDFCALTPHIENKNAMQPWNDRQIRAYLDAVNQHNVAGEMATLAGYEWTNWDRYGNHVVYFPSDECLFAGTHDADSDTLDKLCRKLKPTGAIVVPHRVRACIDWANAAYRQHAEMFPVVEMVSACGTSELGEPTPVVPGAVGDHVRSALQRGLRMGFIGSSNTHNGRPNYVLDEKGAVSRPGLCAVIVDKLDRKSVFEALRQRRTYATTGQRVLIDFRLNGYLMGEVVQATFIERHLTMKVWAPERMTHIEVLKNGSLIYSQSCRGNFEDVDFRDYIVTQPVDWYYVRISLASGGAAWTSPVWVVQDL